MSAGNLLVVLFPDGSEEQLQQAVADRREEPLELRIVAPAHVGPLEWLATDEDDARREASSRALAAEQALADRADVEAEAGDIDPVQAVEDALRSFPADEILIVGGASRDGAMEASLRQFNVPVSRAGGPPPASERPHVQETARAVVAGRSPATPFVFFAGVNLVFLALALVVAAVVLLVLWLR